MRQIRAVLFDAGDTLLAADPPVTKVYREAFARHGVDATEESVRAAVHATWRDVDAARHRGEERWGGPDGERGFWARFVGTVFARSGGGTMPPSLLDELVAHFAAEENWTLFPETLEVLGALRSAGLTLVVVSNWDSTLPALLGRLRVADAVDHVVVSALVGVSKPSKGIFDEAVRRAGVRHAEALHVGDSLVDDYDGARSAGLSALLLDRKGRARDGVDAIASLSDVVGRVLGP